MFLLISAALAANYDPALDWRTLDTEHFNITFHRPSHHNTVDDPRKLFHHTVNFCRADSYSSGI